MSARILVIEDNAVLRSQVVEILEAAGHEVTAAADLQGGLAELRTSRPALVVSDIMLPDGEGYAVLDHLRADRELRTTPLIFITARVSRQDQRRAMAAGADDFLTKPFSAAELLDSVAMRIERARSEAGDGQDKRHKDYARLAELLPHEARSALNGVLGFSELLVQEAADRRESWLADMAHEIHRSGHRLFRTLENLIVFFQSEAGGVASPGGDGWNVPGSDLAEVLPAVAHRTAEMHDRGGDLRIAVAGDALTTAPRNTVARCFEELLDNAFRFSPPGSPVFLQVHRDRDVLHCTVIDQGAGARREQVEDPKPFLQPGEPRVAQDGLGLGLVTTKRLLDAVGGRLAASSPGPAGTCVTVILPVASSRRADRPLG